MISAFDNFGSISYPAAFPEVLGVVSGEMCYTIDDVEFIEDENNIVNFGCLGCSQSVVNEKGNIIASEGNSLACAHLSGIIAKRYKNNMTNDIKSIIRIIDDCIVERYYIPSNMNLEKYDISTRICSH